MQNPKHSPLEHTFTSAEQAFSLSSALSLLNPMAICATKSCCVPDAMVRLKLSCCTRQEAPPRWENRGSVVAPLEAAAAPLQKDELRPMGERGGERVEKVEKEVLRDIGAVPGVRGERADVSCCSSICICICCSCCRNNVPSFK